MSGFWGAYQKSRVAFNKILHLQERSGIIEKTILIKKEKRFMLSEGMYAPAFTLADKGGNMVSLADFPAKKLFFIFIPKTIRPAVRGRPVRLRPHTANLKRKTPS